MFRFLFIDIYKFILFFRRVRKPYIELPNKIGILRDFLKIGSVGGFYIVLGSNKLEGIIVHGYFIFFLITDSRIGELC